MAKKKSKLPKIIGITVVLLLILGLVGAKLGWFGDGEEISVSVDPVKEQTISELVSASGKVQPEFEVKLSSEVSGEVIELHVKEGDRVEKGQILCRIKPDLLQSGYDQTVAMLNQQRANLAASQQVLKQQEANLKNIEATYRRSQELFNKRVISASEMDKARSDFEGGVANLESQKQQVVATRFGVVQSQAQMKEASDNLSRTTIYAPAAGIISLLSVEQGERVVGTAQMAGTEIMRIANMAIMEVNVDVNENDINRVKLGNAATIEVDAYQGRKFKGIVTEIGSSSTSASSTVSTTAEQVTNFNVKVRIDSASYSDLMSAENRSASPFKPGLSATVQVHTKQAKGLIVPIQSVTVRTETDPADTTTKVDPKEYVFVLKGAVVKQVEVKTSIQDDNHILITSGLKKGELVVSRPFNAITKLLKNDSKVKKVEASELK